MTHSSSRRATALRVVALVLAGLPSAIAHAPDALAASGDPVLIGRAVLPAETLAPGPPSGSAATSANGIVFPLPSQPVQGLSSIVAGREPGEYLAMPDNGYGAKGNSRDFNIRAYYIRPDFHTAAGGSGSVQVEDWIEFTDPNHLMGFPIVNDATAGRVLTGGDIDPESLQRGSNGDLWVGDEFGPWVLHFDTHGVLLDAPIPTPGGLMSPNNPFLNGQPATQPNSRGFEAMASEPNGKHLYPILEGPTVAEGVASLNRLVFQVDTETKAFTGVGWTYHVQPETPFVADAWSIDEHRMVVIERDGLRLRRDVYLVDRREVGANNVLMKHHVVNLAEIPDPNLVSLYDTSNGTNGLGEVFSVACESIEAIYPINGTELLLGCDNNLPNAARQAGVADDTEFIVVKVPGLHSLG